MAKTGTSLIGKADTILVRGAYKTALSNVGLDMGEIYEQEVEDIKAFGEAFNDIVYATNKSNNDLFAEIKEGSAEMLANIDAGTYTDDEFIEKNSSNLYSRLQIEPDIGTVGETIDHLKHYLSLKN